MIYNFSNGQIKINGQEILAESVVLSTTADIDPVFLEGQRSTKDFSGKDNIKTNLKLSYLVTGDDPLFEYVADEQNHISGNFGGLYFDSGYLISYSFNGEPNSKFVVEAEILAFEKIKGKFSPSHLSAQKKTTLCFTDAIITDLSGEFSEIINNPLSFSYSYSLDIEPFYADTLYESELDILPQRISFGEKKISSSISCENLSGYLPINGGDFRMSLSFSHPTESLSSIYFIQGKISSKDISARIGSPIVSNLAIVQSSVGSGPSILGFPPSGIHGETIPITGNGFANLQDVKFNDISTTNFSIISNTLVEAVVPEQAIDGPITVKNEDGIDVSALNFLITPEPIVVFDFSPIIESIGNSVTIEGENFYRISHVLFSGSEESSFEVINDETIRAEIPNDAQWGIIDVVSIQRNVSGALTGQLFIPNPEISDFSPKTGFFGTSVLITGKALKQVERVSFNNIDGVIQSSNNLSILVEVPDGNTRGELKVFGQSGTFDTADFDFKTVVLITGLQEYSGNPNDVVRILGENFDEDLMLEDDLNLGFYIVDFNGQTGSFERINDGLMSGFVPQDTISGPVKILDTEGGFYESNINWVTNSPFPAINSFNPLSGEVGDVVSLIGSGLKDIFYINMSGEDVSGNALGYVFLPNDISESYNGLSASFVIEPNTQTGFYDFYVQTLIGLTNSNPSTKFHHFPDIVDGEIGPSGNPGAQLTGNFGLYVTPGGTNSIDVYNLSDFQITIILPGFPNYYWESSSENQSVPFIIPANSSNNLSLTVANSSVFVDDGFEFTGTWTSEDEYSGKFVAYGALGS